MNTRGYCRGGKRGTPSQREPYREEVFSDPELLTTPNRFHKTWDEFQEFLNNVELITSDTDNYNDDQLESLSRIFGLSMIEHNNFKTPKDYFEENPEEIPYYLTAVELLNNCIKKAEKSAPEPPKKKKKKKKTPSPPATEEKVEELATESPVAISTPVEETEEVHTSPAPMEEQEANQKSKMDFEVTPKTKLIIRGLEPGMRFEKIRIDLEQKGIRVEKIIKMRHVPLFIIVLPQPAVPEELPKKICGTTVTIEPFNGSRRRNRRPANSEPRGGAPTTHRSSHSPRGAPSHSEAVQVLITIKTIIEMFLNGTNCHIPNRTPPTSGRLRRHNVREN